MVKLTRKTLLQFGSTANPASEIGQYGSYLSPVYTNDVATLQAGTAWPRGWAGETVATNRPFLEDFNAVDYVFGYMLCYLLQEGLAEWDSATTYYQYSRCQYNGVSYTSLQDTNLNQTPGLSNSTYWQAVGDVKGADIASASSITLGSDGNIFKITGTTTINTIVNPNSIAGVTLIFAGVLTVTSAGNIILTNGNLLTAVNTVMNLVWNGSSWVEVTRSVQPSIVGYGNPISRTAGTIYLAATDGILVGYTSTSQNNGFAVLSDSNPTPVTTVISGFGVWSSGAPAAQVSINCPIKKGNYYQVQGTRGNSPSRDDSVVALLNFIPSGT